MSDDRSGDESHQTSSNVSSAGGEQPTLQNEEELATKSLYIEHKRFYLDVKQNARGRFIKITELENKRHKNRLFLSMVAAKEFRDHLTTFSKLYASLGPTNIDNCPEDGRIKSEMMIKDNRRYFLVLKENARGRFLRVIQMFTQLQDPRSRTQIAIPAQGMIEFRDALTDLLEEYYTEDSGPRIVLPEGTNLRVDKSKFYFDIGEDKNGVFMRISEVKSSTRSSISIPEQSWARFRDIFADYVDKMNQNNGNATSTTGSDIFAAGTSASSTGGGSGSGGSSNTSASAASDNKTLTKQSETTKTNNSEAAAVSAK